MPEMAAHTLRFRLSSRKKFPAYVRFCKWLRTYFMELITELHLSGNIEIVEMVPKKI